MIKICFNDVFSGLSILLPVKFSDVSANFIVDTGAVVTILSSNIYNSLPPDIRPPLEKIDPNFKLEVANEGYLSILGTATLSFTIHKDVFKWKFFIAPISEDGLLGLDFLQENNFNLSADQGLRLNKKKYPTQMQTSVYRAVRVKCSKSVVVPARSEMVIEGCCANGKFNAKVGVVTPLKNNFKDENSVIVGHSLVNPSSCNGRIPIRLMNTSSTEVRIEKNTTLGCIEEVEEISSPKENKHCDVKNLSKLPPHLSGLYENSVII